MTSGHAVLIGQLRQFLADLEQIVARSQRLLQKYKVTQDEDYVGTLALNLHGFYTGVERCFEEIARQLDDTVPSGTDRLASSPAAANVSRTPRSASSCDSSCNSSDDR